MKNVRVRFAPSPTGPLHIGGVRTALYNYLFAKKFGGDFLLRIEDTDQSRYVSGAEDYIIKSLKWCNINFDEGVGFSGDCGPYRQSERKSIYEQYVQKLIDNGNAYYAFDTVEELEQMRLRMKQAGVPSPQYNQITRNNMKNSLSLSNDEVKNKINSGQPYVIRVKMPRNEEIKINDLIRGWVVVNTNNLDDKVIFKSDGMPTYHLANVVDDHLMKISHVIRGEEWLPSAPLHYLLYRFFGWECPEFAHLPLILKPDGNGKLSKRDGDRLGFPVFPLEWKNPETGELSSGYKESGYFPEAFINMLAFLGWNPGTEQELFTMDELIKSFSLKRVGKAGAKFDFDKTKWFNQQYLRRLNSKELLNLVQPYFLKNNFAEETLIKIIDLVKERTVFPIDFLTETDFFFDKPKKFDEKTIRKKWKNNISSILNDLCEDLRQIEVFSSKNIEEVFKILLSKYNLGFGAVLPCFRLSITGKSAGPSIFAISEILGKEEVILRIKNATNIINETLH